MLTDEAFFLIASCLGTTAVVFSFFFSAAIYTPGHNLRRLSVGGCHLLTGKSLQVIQTHCSKVYKLAIHGTAFGMCGRLVYLTSLITSDAKLLSSFFKASPNLRKVAVSESSGFQKIVKKQLPEV